MQMKEGQDFKLIVDPDIRKSRFNPFIDEMQVQWGDQNLGHFGISALLSHQSVVMDSQL